MAAFTRRPSVGANVLGREFAEHGRPVVVGLDFGTSLSGIAWVYRNDPGTIRYDAPGAVDMQTKVPTVLLRHADGTWKFGNQAVSEYRNLLIEGDGDLKGAQYFRRFKMILGNRTSGVGSIVAYSEKGERYLLIDLVTAVLKTLKEFAMHRLTNEPSISSINSPEDVQWLITVPATWNDFGKAFMRRAAFQAGITADELSDNLVLVMEPEAAAEGVLEGFSELNVLRVGSRFMVVSGGGGTCGMTAYEVTQTVPSINIREICAPTGGVWGGENVNANFRTFLSTLLTAENFKEAESAFDFEEIYGAFERMKEYFNPSSSSTVGTLNVRNVLENKQDLKLLVEEFNKKCDPALRIAITQPIMKGHLPISRDLMLSFFEPVVVEMVNCIRGVLNHNTGISNITVVGGFGACVTVKERLVKEFADESTLTVTVPTTRLKPQGAAVFGAVYRGQYKPLITHRIAAHTYGVALRGGKFRVLVSKNADVPFDSEVRITGLPVESEQEFIKWSVYRSDLPQPSDVTSQTMDTMIGTLSLRPPPPPPGGSIDDRAVTAVFKFGESENQIFSLSAAGEMRRVAIEMD